MSVATCCSGIEPFVRLFASGSPGARVVEIDPLVGSVIPAPPERDCVTTTLQASRHGAPVYERMGYADLGVDVNLWERRPD